MLHIILCDDDRFILQLSQEKIEQAIYSNQLEAKISCKTTESSEMLQYISKNEGNYLVFLDLDFGYGKLNGIDVAKQIRKITSDAKVVFTTNHFEMAMQVLSSGVEPFGFLEKTTDMNELTQGYVRYIQMAISLFAPQVKEEDVLNLTVGIGEVIKIDKSQILYLEAEKSISHGISYHTMDGSCITVRDTMEHCREVIGEGYIRVHRSFLVHGRYMVSLHGTMIKMANGEQVPCAVRMLHEVKKWLK
ncbi:MAG: DNA-binding response regulator [Lachnospiraceae bacterium]